MRGQKPVFALILTMALLCVTNLTTYAYEVPDLNRKGTIMITLRYGKNAVGGGNLILYRVGDIKEDNGNYSFTLTGDFTLSDESLEKVESAELAARLASYAKRTDAAGTEIEIDSKGRAAFTEREPGLYLLRQSKAAEGYERLEPFLVSVPLLEDGAYIYDVNASPKVEPEKKKAKPEDSTKEPGDSGKSTETAGEGGTDTPTLPRTGQLNWPVPVLAALGLCLFAAGWRLRFGKKRNDHAE